MFPIGDHPPTSSSDKGIKSKNCKKKNASEYIVKAQWLGIETKQFRTQLVHLIGKIGSKTHRTKLHDEDKQIFHHLITRNQKINKSFALSRAFAHRHTDEKRENNECQNMLPR